MVKLRFVSDPAHAWLEVPMGDLTASGVRPSKYSYYDPKTHLAYLEEDCDADIYLATTSITEFDDYHQPFPSFVRELDQFPQEA
jgi:hypothetical protein